VLQYWSLIEIELFGKTYIISWFLMTISKDQSTHSEPSILQVSSVLNIFMKNGYAFHNVSKDGYHNIDSPCDQLNCNFGIYRSNVELEQVKVNCWPLTKF
jgi:hypothetical protein